MNYKLWPEKVKNQIGNLIKVKWHINWTCDMTLEFFFKGYNFALESPLIKVCIEEFWAHKIARFITLAKLENFRNFSQKFK